MTVRQRFILINACLHRGWILWLVISILTGALHNADPASHSLPDRYKKFDIPIRSIAVSPDDSLIAASEWDLEGHSSVFVWNAKNWILDRELIGSSNPIYSIDFSPDGQWIASCSINSGSDSGYSQIVIWNVQTGEIVYSSRQRGTFRSIVFSPDGKYLLAAGNTSILWELTTFQVLNTIDGSLYTRTSSFSPDVRYFTIDSKIYSVLTGNLFSSLHSCPRYFRTPKSYDMHFDAISVSPCGRYMLSADEDVLWDVQSGEDICVFNKSNKSASYISQFSSDGQYFTLSGPSNEVNLWRTDTRQLVHNFFGHSGNVRDVAFFNNNDELVSCGDDGYVFHWPIPETIVETPVDIPESRMNVVFTTDDIETKYDLGYSCDYDKGENTLAVKWLHDEISKTHGYWSHICEQQHCYHIYALVNDDEKYLYLGQIDDRSATAFVWNKKTPSVYPLFRGGPQPGMKYSFKVYAITSESFIAETGGYSIPVEMLDSPPIAPTYINDATKTLIVTDDLRSYSDLSGWKDEDSDRRALYLRWNYPMRDTVDFHLYVKVDGAKEAQYLGRTRFGNISYFAWEPDSPYVTEPFKDGPQYGHRYQFMLFAIRQLDPVVSDGPYTTKAPILYLAKNPIPTGRLYITDDMNAEDDLSDQSDSDSTDRREIGLRWNFPVTDVRDYHIYVSIDDGDWNYLGRTNSALARDFEWKEDAPFLNALYRTGPQFGHRYAFKVYAIGKSGDPYFHGPIHSKGGVIYQRE